MSSYFHLPLSDTKPEPFSETEVANFALRTGWIDDVGVITPGRTMIERRALSWWPDHDLIVAHDPAWGSTVAAWVIREGERLIRLPGQAPPIHALNASLKPVFTADNALAYLGFFCLFIRGDAGPFGIVCSIEDGFLPADLDREKIAPYLREAVLLQQTPVADDETAFSFDVEAPVYHGDALFLANFRLFPNGMVEMLSDEPLVGDLGVALQMPLTFPPPPPLPGTDDPVH